MIVKSRATCDKRLLGNALRHDLGFLISHFWLLSGAFASLLFSYFKPPSALAARSSVKFVKLTAYQLLLWRLFPAAEWDFLIWRILRQKFTTAAIAFGSWPNARFHLLRFLVFSHYYHPSDEATISSISAQRRLMPSKTSFLR